MKWAHSSVKVLSKSLLCVALIFAYSLDVISYSKRPGKYDFVVIISSKFLFLSRRPAPLQVRYDVIIIFYLIIFSFRRKFDKT